MWAQFATTFRFSLRSVITRPVTAMLFGAAGGPIAFLAGERLGAVTLLPPLGQILFRPSISWAVALVAFSAVVRRVAPERHAGYKRIRHDGPETFGARSTCREGTCAGLGWVVSISANGRPFSSEAVDEARG
jgi:Protein of unknown function (DUF2878)